MNVAISTSHARTTLPKFALLRSKLDLTASTGDRLRSSSATTVNINMMLAMTPGMMHRR